MESSSRADPATRLWIAPRGVPSRVCNYPPLPKEFHGPYLELRAIFMYNTEPPK